MKFTITFTVLYLLLHHLLPSISLIPNSHFPPFFYILLPRIYLLAFHTIFSLTTTLLLPYLKTLFCFYIASPKFNTFIGFYFFSSLYVCTLSYPVKSNPSGLYH